MDNLWGFQHLMQLSSACTATAASALAPAPSSNLQSLFNEWGGNLQSSGSPVMPPSPQTMKGNYLGAAATAATAAAQAPGSLTHLPPRTNSSHFSSPKASPKTPKASRKAYAKEDEPEAEADPCGPTLETFAGRYGFTVTTSNTCTSYRNARCSHEIVLENRASAPKAETEEADADAVPAAVEPVNSLPVEVPPAAPPAPAAGSMMLPWPAADNGLMLPPMPRLPFTALLSQASFQQPATPAAAAAAERPAAAASPQCSPAFFRTVSTGMPVLLRSTSSAHNSQTLTAVPAAATGEIHQAGNICISAAAAARNDDSSNPNMMFAQAWAGGLAAQVHSSPNTAPHTDVLQQLSNYLQSLPEPASAQQQQQQQQQQRCTNWDALSGLQQQASCVFAGVELLDVEAPARTRTKAGGAAASATAVMMPADWSPMQSMGLDCHFDATQQYLAAHDHQQQQQQQQQQQAPSSRTRTTPTKPSSPGKIKREGSPSKSRRDGSPSRNSSSSNRQQTGATAAYQQILRRSLPRPKSRGPKYDPYVKTAAAAAARYGTGASLLGKHRLSNCSSMEDRDAGPEGMPHEWAGSASLNLNELDSWDDAAFASGCLGGAGSLEMAESLGLEGLEGYVCPLDSAFGEEDGLQQLQQPHYACMPAAAVAAAAGTAPGARRASSMSSDWFRELGVPDLAASRRGSLLGDIMSINAPAAAVAASPLLAASAGPGLSCYRSSYAEVESEVQRGLAYRPVWGVQACVGQLGKQCLLDGNTTPDKFYDGLFVDS